MVGGSNEPGKTALNMAYIVPQNRDQRLGIGKNIDGNPIMVYHKSMKHRGLLLLLPFLLVLFMILACGSAPQTPVRTEPASTQIPVLEEPVTHQASIPEQAVVVQPFNPGAISAAQYEAAKLEVQALIADLNRIIRARNYEAWVNHLADSYYALINSRDFLEERTEELYRRDVIVAQNMGRDPRMVERRILRTGRDFFLHIVVPSRSNDRVDDIDFVSENRVKAFTIDTRGNRLILYDLEIIDGRWKIVS